MRHVKRLLAGFLFLSVIMAICGAVVYGVTRIELEPETAEILGEAIGTGVALLLGVGMCYFMGLAFFPLENDETNP